MGKNYWIVKSETDSYSWTDFLKDGKTPWTGVRNYAARNNLRAMKSGDNVLFYHSGSDKQIVGIGVVQKEFYSDPTAKEGDWSCVDLAPLKPMKAPVTLERMKADHALNDLPLIRQSRLSVSPLNQVQFQRLLELSGTKI